MTGGAGACTDLERRPAMTGVEAQDCILAEAQAMAWWRRLQYGMPNRAELEEFGVWMTTPAHAVAYADCEWSAACLTALDEQGDRSEEHTSELQSLMHISNADFCLEK